MPTPITDEKIGQRLWQDAKAAAIGTKKLAGPAPGTKQYTPDEELLLWNTEDKGWTMEKEMELLASGKSPRAVGLLKYPHRQKLMESGERALDKYAQFVYASKLAQRADPSWKPPVPQGAMPPNPLPDVSPSQAANDEGNPPLLDAVQGTQSTLGG